MTQAAIGLTTQDIAALRTAQSMSFYLSPKGSFMAATLHSTPPGEDRVRHEIAVEYFLKAFDEPRHDQNGRKQLSEVVVCHYYMAVADFDETWQTIVSLLRQGDHIKLCWLRDAQSNDYLRNAGIHADRLDFVVERKGDKPNSRLRRMRFMLAVSCCQDNTARMIRRGAFNNE